MSFICYKITSDTGFAPNPHFNVITLATCKPSIRRTKTNNDWVAGFSTKTLANNFSGERRKELEQYRLIYLMCVEETLTPDEYYKNPNFANKKPVYNHKNDAVRAGDNIYFKNGDRYFVHKNNSHPYMDENYSNLRPNIDHDIRGEKVLVANMKLSYYFGDKCLIPKNGWGEIGFAMSTGRVFCRTKQDLENLLKFIDDCGFQPGFCGTPCLHPSIDVEAKVTCGSSCSGALLL